MLVVTYKDIQTTLEKLNYKCYHRKLNKNLKFFLCGVPDEETMLKTDNTYKGFIEGGILKLEYRKGQIPVEKLFKVIDELTSFVTKQFPMI